MSAYGFPQAPGFIQSELLELEPLKWELNAGCMTLYYKSAHGILVFYADYVKER